MEGAKLVVFGVVFLAALHKAVPQEIVSDTVEYTVNVVPKTLLLEPQQVVR